MLATTPLNRTLCGVLSLSLTGANVMASDEFPFEASHDAIMPGSTLVQNVLEWVAEAFAGVPRPGQEQRAELQLRRQDHGMFAFGQSCIGTPLKIGQRPYKHGLGTHANSEIAVTVPLRARTFSAQVGVDNNYDTQGKHGSVQFSVEAGGREVFRTPTLRGGDEPVAVNLNLPADVKQLVLKVDTTPDGPAYDQSDWAEARFILEDGASVWLDEKQADSLLMKGTPPFSFRYGDAASAELLATWPRTAETREEPDRREYRVHWTDRETRLRVTAEITVHRAYAAVDWVLYFENEGSQDTPILADVQALDVSLSALPPPKTVVLHQIKGDTCAADTFLPFDTPLAAGHSVQIAPVGGRSSSGSFPFMNLQVGDRGLLTAIGWTGQWAASVARDGGVTRFQAGMEQTHLRLHPGERIRTPRILLLPWQGDLQSSHNRFRRLMLLHYAPQQDGRPVRPPVALQCFDRYSGRVPEWATEAGQRRAAQAAHEIGCDTVWLDAAWFPGNFPNGVGNWSCKPAEFPDGLKPVSDACHALGLKFMVWFEPERVAGGTQIAREHPDFVFGGASGGLFKLNEPDARRWLTDLLSDRVTRYGIDIYRNDFNIDPLKFWRANDAPDRQGITEIRYVEGLYAMWDELRARHPALLIDNCASGGRRIDLEMCRRSLPLWRSDTGCSTNPVDWNQVQCHGLSLYIPYHAVASWTPSPYDVRSVSSAGVVCQWDYLSESFPLELARASVAEARENQEFWLGDFYPLTPCSTAPDLWAAYQFHRADLDAGLVLVFRRNESNYTALSLRFRGLTATAMYRVDQIDDARERTSETVSGEELLSGIEVSLPRKAASLLIRYAPAALPTSAP